MNFQVSPRAHLFFWAKPARGTVNRAASVRLRGAGIKPVPILGMDLTRTLFLLLAAVLSLPVAASADGGFFVADDTRTLAEVLRHITTIAPSARPGAEYVVVTKDTQVAELRATAKSASAVRAALSRGVRIYACESDLVLFGVKPATLAGGVIVAGAATGGTASDEPAAPARSSRSAIRAKGRTAPDDTVAPLERFTKQVQKACRE